MEPDSEPFPDVSIIIPSYCAAATIVRAIGSALLQTGVEVEVVIADDASNDDTVAVVLDTFGSDQRVRIVSLEKNCGPSVARNSALALARGRWLAVVDADDFLVQDRIATLVKRAQDQCADMVVDAYYLCREDTLAPYAIRSQFTSDVITPINLVRHNLGSGKPLFSRRILDSGDLVYDTSLRYGEDIELMFRLLSSGYTCAFVEQPKYLKVATNGSLTARRLPMMRSVLALYTNLLGKYGSGNEELSCELSRAIAFQRDSLSFHELLNHLREHNLRQFCRAAITHPSRLLGATRHFLFRKRRFGEHKVGNEDAAAGRTTA